MGIGEGPLDIPCSNEIKADKNPNDFICEGAQELFTVNLRYHQCAVQNKWSLLNLYTTALRGL